ncbi:PASTA domain-containing protein [Phycicoccus sp. Root101]|uniref:PASTA domain-containing protein n=1 Tax=Phycicoccus sp. Root101 TaxID=1736421 RepID=UPI00138F3DAA|nr:PASTA domain-containing protein [Phycicoccus sp. Root101]
MDIGRSTARRTGGLAALSLVVCLLATGCGPTTTVPDVVGMRLDDAHRKFEALGLESSNDKDIIGAEDVILRDANWVVIKQDPAPGTVGVDTDATVALSVGREDDAQVLKLIPPQSAFAREMAHKRSDSESKKQVQGGEKTPTVQSPTTAGPSITSKSTVENFTAAVQCARRGGNAGEIYVWNSYGSDQPPDAMRLGGGYVWDHGRSTCLTSTEFALSTVPRLTGYCTEVGRVSANPRYVVDALPASRIPTIVGRAGDC